MKNINGLKMLSFVLIAAYLLAACSGGMPEPSAPATAPKVQANVVAFTGIVEAMNGSQWTVSGQQVTVESQTALDPNISVGDRVKVEASVSADGAVVALKVESSAGDDVVSTPSADGSSTPDPLRTPSPDGSSTPDTSSTPGASVPQPAGNQGNEVFGIVEAMTAESITVNGIVYSLANFTEFKDAIFVGDQVKLHVIANPDGTLTIREIEKSQGVGNDNSNDAISNDDNGNDANSNDDNGNGSNSNDDNGNDANSNDDNGGGNDDDGGNGNGSGGNENEGNG